MFLYKKDELFLINRGVELPNLRFNFRLKKKQLKFFMEKPFL